MLTIFAALFVLGCVAIESIPIELSPDRTLLHGVTGGEATLRPPPRRTW